MGFFIGWKYFEEKDRYSFEAMDERRRLEAEKKRARIREQKRREKEQQRREAAQKKREEKKQAKLKRDEELYEKFKKAEAERKPPKLMRAGLPGFDANEAGYRAGRPNLPPGATMPGLDSKTTDSSSGGSNSTSAPAGASSGPAPGFALKRPL